MNKAMKQKSQQPEALAELAKTSREKTPGKGDRALVADAENKPLPAKNASKHEVAETLLAAGARGKKLDPHKAGVDELPDRTRVRN
jgi:hypothetical protein